MDNFIAAHLHKLILTENGFSYSPISGDINPRNGYMVATPHSEKIIPFIDFTSEDIQNFEKENSIGLNDYIGAWYNDEDQCVYMDISILIEDKEKAILLGIENNQIAIFDNAKKEVITLPTPIK